MQKSLRGTMVDIALNIGIPYLIYTVAHNYFHASEILALTLSSVYPIFDIIIEFYKDHTLNFISVIVLIGTVTGIIGALISGDPKLVLIRESFFTFLLGLACFVTLIFGKPLMFYFAREFVAGKDAKKRKEFTEILQHKRARNLFRLITLVWGIVYVVEFIVKIFIVYTFSISLTLIVSPISTYGFTFAALAWTFWYSKKFRHD